MRTSAGKKPESRKLLYEPSKAEPERTLFFGLCSSEQMAPFSFPLRERAAEPSQYLPLSIEKNKGLAESYPLVP